MIEVSIAKRGKDTAAGTASVAGFTSTTTTERNTVLNSEHAALADKATEAEHAALADKATEAEHAATAAALDADSPTRDEFLSKTHDDSTPYRLGMGSAEVKGDAMVKGSAEVKGDAEIKGDTTTRGITNNGKFTNTGTLDNAGGIDNKGDLNNAGDIYNTGDLTTHNIKVTGKATFFELEIQKATAAGGLQIYSSGSGKADIVEETHIDTDTLEETAITDDNRATVTANAYKLYQLATEEGGKNALLMVQAGDLLCCYEFNGASNVGTYSGAANRYWWRKCIKVNANPVIVSGKSYYEIYVSVSDCADGSSTPKAGDRFMVLGSKVDTQDNANRRNAIVICAHEGLDSGLKAPYIAQYVGINSYDLQTFRRSWWGYKKDGTSDVHFIGNFSVESDNTVVRIPADRGAWTEGTRYFYYDRVSYDGSLWLMTKYVPDGTTEEPSLTSGYWTLQVAKGEQGEKGEEPLQIRISGGTIIRNSTGSVTLTATAWRGTEDVTALYPDACWYWTRESGMAEYDKAWNARHEGIGRVCTLTAEDITMQASIACEIRE